MRSRDIPRNPNMPTVSGTQGLDSHWLRTIVLAVLVVLVGYLMRGRLVAPRMFLPVADIVRPALAPDTAAPTPAVVAPPEPDAIVGTALPASLDKAQAREVLDRFNAAFRDGRARADAAGLAAVAAGAGLAYEQGQIALLRGAGQTQRWTPLSMDIQGVASHDGRVVVCTSERWERVAVGADGVAGPAEPLSYVERYTLVFQGNTWLVSELSYPASCSA
ncbi:MAG: hypothetical protein IPO81_31530 [Kouleothrix sp.]|nr:hypothetical protein [Kouleothrix sp.]